MVSTFLTASLRNPGLSRRLLLVQAAPVSVHDGEFLDGPVEDMVVLKSFADEQIAEGLAEVGVVGPVVKLQALDVLEVARESVGEPMAQVADRGLHLLLFDQFVSLVLGRGLQALPR